VDWGTAQCRVLAEHAPCPGFNLQNLEEKKKKDPRYNPFLKASSYVIKERSI
jgi:hypothetical protein